MTRSHVWQALGRRFGVARMRVIRLIAPKPQPHTDRGLDRPSDSLTSEQVAVAISETPDRDIETTSSLIVITDPYGLFLHVSPSVKNIIGYEQYEIEGRLAADFIHPLDLDEARDETRLIRRTGRPRHFYSRYVGRNRASVELIWTGVWLPKRRQFVFTGRKPRGRERPPLVHRLNVLDGFQLSKGLFCLSLLVAYLIFSSGQSTFEVRRIVEQIGGSAEPWVVLTALYIVGSALCVVWKNRWFQLGFSVASAFLWLWTGTITLSAPITAPAVGIFECALGLLSVWALYVRGRHL